MLYLGLVFGVIGGNIAAHEAGLNALRAYIATLILITAALLGSRLLHVATSWDIYRQNPRRILDRHEGGLGMYGGLLAALLVSVPLLSALHLNFGTFWDVSSFTILVGMIFTRVGCLLNGCCYGRPSQSWLGIYLPNSHGVWEKRIPTQAMEAACAVLLLIFAALSWRWMPFPSALFLCATLGYSTARFIMEFARGHEPGSGYFRIAHVISVVAFVSSICTLTLYWRK